MDRFRNKQNSVFWKRSPWKRHALLKPFQNDCFYGSPVRTNCFYGSSERTDCFYGSSEKNECFYGSSVRTVEKEGFYPRSVRQKDTPRGQALIIGNANYGEGNTSLCPSTHLNADLMEAVCKQSGLEVTKKYDLTGFQILWAIRECRLKIDARNDMFVLFYSGHGNRMDFYLPNHTQERGDCILGVDGVPVAIHSLTNMLNNKECPALVDKPKVFMFDSCRGGLQEKENANGNGLGCASQNTMFLTLGTENNENRNTHVPLAADMLIAHSTRDYHVANTPNILSPGFYTKTLFTVAIDPDYSNKSLRDMLDRVAFLMKEQGRPQSANYTSYLTKRIDMRPDSALLTGKDDEKFEDLEKSQKEVRRLCDIERAEEGVVVKA